MFCLAAAMVTLSLLSINVSAQVSTTKPTGSTTVGTGPKVDTAGSGRVMKFLNGCSRTCEATTTKETGEWSQDPDTCLFVCSGKAGPLVCPTQEGATNSTPTELAPGTKIKDTKVAVGSSSTTTTSGSGGPTTKATTSGASKSKVTLTFDPKTGEELPPPTVTTTTPKVKTRKNP